MEAGGAFDRIPPGLQAIRMNPDRSKEFSSAAEKSLPAPVGMPESDRFPDLPVSAPAGRISPKPKETLPMTTAIDIAATARFLLIDFVSMVIPPSIDFSCCN